MSNASIHQNLSTEQNKLNPVQKFPEHSDQSHVVIFQNFLQLYLFPSQQLNNTQNSSSAIITCNFHILNQTLFITKIWIENHLVNNTLTSISEPNLLYQRKLQIRGKKKTGEEWMALFVLLKRFRTTTELAKNTMLKRCPLWPFSGGFG